uniref:Uncharacterized protein n=1 Tax=Anguilla anguilla TaxID=7936 RepID=A0A0E9SRM6_ANGAN
MNKSTNNATNCGLKRGLSCASVLL